MDCDGNSKRMRNIYLVSIIVIITSVQLSSDDDHGQIKNYLKGVWDTHQQKTQKTIRPEIF